MNPNGDTRGATPVIGIVLLVAITVVLGALVGAGVLDLPLPTEDSAAPSASFSADYDDGLLTIRMESGQPLERATLTYVSGNEGGPIDTEDVEEDFPTTVTSTGELVLRVDADDTVRIVWESPDQRSDNTATVFTWTNGNQGR